MHELMIRSAGQDDWQKVWPLLEARGATDSKELAQDRYSYIVRSSSHFLPIAIADHKVIGYGWVQDYGPHLRSGQKLSRFHDLFVLPEHRNLGIAAALFESIRSWAEGNGASWLQWNGNPSSSSFYERLGYTPTPEEEEGFPFFEITFK